IAAGPVGIFSRIFRAQGRLPNWLARPIESQQGSLPCHGCGEENAPVPNNWRRTALSRQGGLPQQVVRGVPFDWEAANFRAPIILRTTPVRPIVQGFGSGSA